MSAPRPIGPTSYDPPIIVFTDGACEDAGVTVGGVLFGPGVVEYFGFVVPDCVVESWKSHTEQRQTIGQAELFPVAVARWTWGSILKDRRAIYFIDNEAARLALVKAYSPVLQSLKLVQDCLEWDRAYLGTPWYARVPSSSNPADDPSRFVHSQYLRALGGVCVRPIISQEFAIRYDFEWGELCCMA